MSHVFFYARKLPYKLKQVILLRYLHDYSQEDIEEILIT
ncbi:sigma factor-like helix-turn-helix DNA-binding protein [Bacillus cytotoxicus]